MLIFASILIGFGSVRFGDIEAVGFYEVSF